MKSRVVAGLIAGLIAIGLAGCTGGAPKASPTPTPPFANADAAYKAAEATYRGYVDAGNHVVLSDPKTFEPVYRWLLGDALRTERSELSAMSAHGWFVSGPTRVTYVTPIPGGTPAWGDVVAASCIDVHNVKLVDATGKSVVAPDRPNFQATTVTFSRDAGTPTGMKITKITKRSGSPACGN